MQQLSGYDFSAHIHCFAVKDQTILLDVNSGSIHLLDTLSEAWVQALIRAQGDVETARKELELDYDSSEVEEVWTEMLELIAEGALFSEPDTTAAMLPVEHVKALCLHAAHACNMRCTYCFASQGDFGLTPSLMNFETGKRAIDFLFANSGDIHNLEVDFFGGEPLLVADMLKELVIYTRSQEKQWNKRVNFTLTTNALLLNEEMMDFVLAEDIGVILSLDGRKTTNDRHRILNDGSGSYERILPNILKMVEKEPISYYVRGTFTRDNLDFTEDLAHLAEQGFDCISLEPATGPKNPNSIKQNDLPQVLAEYERLTEKLLSYHQQGQDIHFFHYNLQLQGGPCLAKRGSGCGAGVEYLSITPEGDVYPCHQLVGEENFLMGNILNGQPLKAEIRETFAKNRMEEKICRRCWVRYFCGGGCHANAYFQHDDMKIPEETGCIMHKKRVEQAIYLDVIKRLAI